MSNPKIIGIIIVAIIIAVSVFAINGVDELTNNTETSEPIDDSAISISDSAILEKNKVESNNNPNFYIDEEGIKRFTISASDSPDLGD